MTGVQTCALPIWSKELIDGIKSITSKISDDLGSLEGEVGGILNEFKSKGGDLLSAVTNGLPKGIASELQGALSSIGPGGLVKAPTVALDTNNIGEVVAQLGALMGNPKVPVPNLGNLKIPSEPLSKEKVAEYDKLSAEIKSLEDTTRWDDRKAYLDAEYKYGSDAPQTVSAKAKYQETLTKIEDLKQKLTKVLSS